MLKIQLIRHAKTNGNILKRYIGTTDEPLSEEGINMLLKKSYKQPDILITTPLLRCIQTCKILFPKVKPYIIDDLKECDFGLFENKNYIELKDNKAYKDWIASDGKMPFPNGESRYEVKQRTLRGFFLALQIAKKKHSTKDKNIYITFVVHGGTIMHLLESFAEKEEQKSFYDWQIENACGYEADIKDSFGKDWKYLKISVSNFSCVRSKILKKDKVSMLSCKEKYKLYHIKKIGNCETM